MIFIDRLRLDAKGLPIRPAASWQALADAATQLAKNQGSAHQVTDLYRHPEVKAALEELFHRKCAYCEGPLRGAWDVEHFRPKGEVAECPGHPGYYWLAYFWPNLYPACETCNRKRRDLPLWEDATTLPVAGKAAQFPLAEEQKRAMDHLADLAGESPLLLDPCNPTDVFDGHFVFDVHGQIHPADETDRRAQKTIEICNLTFRRLRDERSLILQRTAKAIAVLRLARDKDASPAIVALLESQLEDLVRDSAHFAAAARCVLRDPGAFASLA